MTRGSQIKRGARARHEKNHRAELPRLIMLCIDLLDNPEFQKCANPRTHSKKLTTQISRMCKFPNASKKWQSRFPKCVNSRIHSNSDNPEFQNVQIPKYIQKMAIQISKMCKFPSTLNILEIWIFHFLWCIRILGRKIQFLGRKNPDLAEKAVFWQKNPVFGRHIQFLADHQVFSRKIQFLTTWPSWDPTYPNSPIYSKTMKRFFI